MATNGKKNGKAKAEAKASKKPIQNRGNGRASDGKFAPGNPGGPGNPYFNRINQLRDAVSRAVTDSEIIGVLRVLHGKAMKGDVAAAKVLLERVLGKPPQPVELTGMDGGPLMKVVSDIDIEALCGRRVVK